MTPNKPVSTQVTRGYSIALVSALLLSTTSIFIRYLTQNFQIPALVLAFWRDVLGCLVVLPVLAVVKPAWLRVEHKDFGFLVLYGVILAAFNALWTLSVAFNGAAVGTVLVYSSAAFTALLGRLLLKESLGWVKGLAVILSFGGCFLVSGVADQSGININLPGIVIGILAGLLYAVYSLMGRFSSQRGLHPWTTLPYTFGLAALFLGIFNLLFAGKLPGTPSVAAGLLWQEGTLTGWIILFLLAAGPTVLGFGGYLVSLSYLPSSTANLLMTSEPAFTTITAFFLLGERMTIRQVMGSLLIIAGVVFIRVMESKLVKKGSRSVEESQPATD